MDVNGSVALVTGGASGLGLATTEKLVENGAKVVIVDLPSSAGEAVADKLGDAVRFAPADVTNEEQITAALDVAAELGELRVTVNCAGIGNRFKTFGQATARSRSSRLRQGHQRQPGRHVQRDPARRRADEPRRPGGRRPRRHRQHAPRGRDGGPDRAGRLLRVEGRDRRHDAADRARPRGLGIRVVHDRAGAVRDAAARPALPEDARSRWASRCRTRRAWDSRRSTGSSPRTSSRTRCSTAR